MFERLEINSLTNGNKGAFQKPGVAIWATVLGLHNSGDVDIGFQVYS
jgi:hypothetical protein